MVQCACLASLSDDASPRELINVAPYDRSDKTNPTFSIVLPFFNEAQFLERTLTAWLAQSYRPSQIVLVDNASTDQSEQVARAVLAKATDIEVVYLREERPGKVNALRRGCEAATGEFIVHSDADTYYPAHYLQLCATLSRGTAGACSAIMALGAGDIPLSWRSRFRRRVYVGLQRLFPYHTYTGGFGQVYRTELLQRCGGFSENQWPYVLMDHEIMVRLLQFGPAIYHVDLWCQPAGRRSDRRRVRWNLRERFLYQLLPYRYHDWFFYHFLAKRLHARGAMHLRLREQPWHAAS